jgi:hypothetical protein
MKQTTPEQIAAFEATRDCRLSIVSGRDGRHVGRVPRAGAGSCRWYNMSPNSADCVS